MVNPNPLSPLIFYLVVEAIAFCYFMWRVLLGRPAIPRARLFILPMVAAAGAQAIGAVLQTGLGLLQKAKAAKLARKNVRPDLQSNPYIDQQYGLTGSMAQEGLSDASKQLYLDTNDRNLSASFDAIIKGGGNANNIADAFAGSQDIIRSMALQDDQARLQNRSLFLNYGLKPKADEERDKFFLNQYIPYKDRAEMIAQLSNQGMNNIWKGIDSGLQAATGFASANKPPGGELDGGDFSRYSMPISMPSQSAPSVQVGPAPGSNVGFDESIGALNANTLLKKYFNRGI
jgi:hypothetical protein